MVRISYTNYFLKTISFFGSYDFDSQYKDLIQIIFDFCTEHWGKWGKKSPINWIQFCSSPTRRIQRPLKSIPVAKSSVSNYDRTSIFYAVLSFKSLIILKDEISDRQLLHRVEELVLRCTLLYTFDLHHRLCI